jgi:hypothetical protein
MLKITQPSFVNPVTPVVELDSMPELAYSRVET